MERSRIGCPMMKVKSRPISDHSQAAIVVKVESRPEIEVVSPREARAGKAERAVITIVAAPTLKRGDWNTFFVRVANSFIKHLLK